MDVRSLLFVGFNRKIAALDRRTGDIVWSWTAPDGSGFVTLLLDGDRLMAAVNGYTYCLDPRTGAQLWMNPMKGFGYGVTCLASVQGTSLHPMIGEAQAQQARAETAGGAAATSAT